MTAEQGGKGRVGGAVGLHVRQQAGEGQAVHVLAAAAPQRFGRRIEQHHAMAAVDDERGVDGLLQHVPEAVLRRFDRRLRTNLAVFYVDYRDLQISQFLAGTGGATSAIGRSGASAMTSRKRKASRCSA